LEELKKLWCSNNYLTQIIYPASPEKITYLDISNNNFPSQDLSIFSKFKNLIRLEVSNHDKIKIQQGTYNDFKGSLEPLKDLKKLW
jgi:Leucine-rich repeat (LRR) protein